MVKSKTALRPEAQEDVGKTVVKNPESGNLAGQGFICSAAGYIFSDNSHGVKSRLMNRAEKSHADYGPIDIVVPWVDGNDPAWQLCRNQYRNVPGDKREERYRDWNLMRYWFRGIEKNMGWVRRIHFVTWGHLPDWLDPDHPKLHIVRHEDYIPAEYLPVFSSHPIELNMHRIPDLSERFIYFNDDCFVLNLIRPEDFFCRGLPCDTAALGILFPLRDRAFANILLNDFELMNRNFHSGTVIRSNLTRFLNFRYGPERIISNLLLIPRCQNGFTGFSISHEPNAFLKKTLEAVWDAEKDCLDRTCMNRFRSMEDVNQYIFKWWQWCSGNFHPADMKNLSGIFEAGKQTDQVSAFIRNKEKKIIVINDSFLEPDLYEDTRKKIAEAFEFIYPEKSGFERN